MHNLVHFHFLFWKTNFKKIFKKIGLRKSSWQRFIFATATFSIQSIEMLWLEK